MEVQVQVLAVGSTARYNSQTQTWDNAAFYFVEIDFSLPNRVFEETENLRVDIYPNPAGDFITITISGINPTLKRGVDELSIYNTLGEKVMSESIHPMTSSHRMNIESLPKGIYFVHFGGQKAKFVKM